MTQQQTALEPKEKTPVVSTETESLFEKFKETTQAIAQRAFDIFEKRGRQFGHEVEDWLRAESEVIRRIPMEVKEVGNNLEIRAEVPGFKSEELKIYVEPRRLTISGETEQSSEEEKENTLYSEWHSRKVFRAFDLPREVKTTGAQATLKDGVLKLTLAKAEEAPPSEVTINNA